MTITLLLSFFIDANSIEEIFNQYCMIFDLWNSWKNLLPTSKKLRKKARFLSIIFSALRG